MRARWTVGSAVLWLFGCSLELPSSTPLGSGPLAEPEHDELGPGLGDKRPHTETAQSADEAGDRFGRDAGAVAAKPGDGGPSDDAGAASSRREDGGTASEASAPAAFAGKFCGRDVTTLRCDGRPDDSTPDPNACIQVERKSDAEIEIVIIYTPTGGPFCTLKARTEGNRATIDVGQTCPDPDVAESLGGAVTGGTAELEADRLSVDLEADLQGPILANCPNGALVYHFEGDRK